MRDYLPFAGNRPAPGPAANYDPVFSFPSQFLLFPLSSAVSALPGFPTSFPLRVTVLVALPFPAYL